MVTVCKTSHRMHRKIPEKKKSETIRVVPDEIGKRRFKAKSGLELANEDRTRNKIVSRTAFVIEERRDESDPKQRQTY